MKRGFTLIELLVVIAIIAILAAILFPVFARAREKARQSNCLSNIKQIVHAVLMYNQDNDDTFPAVRVNAAPGWAAPNGDTATPAWVPWLCSVGPYIKNTQIFNCPSASVSWDGGATATTAGDKFNNIGYGYNEYFAAWRYQLSGGYFVPIPSAMVLKPAETMCVIEKGTLARYYIDTRVTYVWSRPGIPSNSLGQDGRLDVGLTRHNEGANVGYADGHAKWLQSTAIPPDNWDGTFVPPPGASGSYATREIQVPSQTANVFWNPDCPW